MKKDNKRRGRAIKIAGAVIFSIFLVFVIAASITLKEWGQGMVIDRGGETITTEFGDSFEYKYSTTNMPSITTNIEVYGNDNKQLIVTTSYKGEFIKSDFIILADTTQIRCYEAYNCLIYRVGEGDFSAIAEYSLINYDSGYIANSNKWEDLFIVAKYFTNQFEWKWIRMFGKFLYQNNDDTINQTLERYSQGDFTQEELDFNKSSGYTKEDMQFYARQVLNE